VRSGNVADPSHSRKGSSDDPPPKSPTVPATRPFAALPHDLREDPALRGRDKAPLLAAALLEYARGKTSCWPSNRRLAEDLGCSPRTVQLALADLRRAGWVRVELGADTPTGRRIVLMWREADCAPSPAPVAPPQAPAVAPEVRRGREGDRPGGGSGREGPPPPSGEGAGEPPASAEDLARFRGWAAAPDAVLARFGRSALRLAGVVEPAAARAEPGPTGGPTVVASPLPAAASGPPPGAGIASRPARHRRSAVAPSRRRQGPRHWLERAVGQGQAPPVLEVWMTRPT
jgi:hypothetical protein